MRASYADLASGRFLILADFNTQPQSLLARIMRADGTEDGITQPTISVLRARDETGAGSLEAMLAHAGDRLVLDGSRSAELALVRDWSAYALLLTSVYGPPDGATLRLTLRSGDGEHSLSWSRRVRIRPGWNLIRQDLVEPADSIDLAEVRAIEWSVAESASAVRIFVDDVVLVNNTETLFGADAAAGALYVFRQGRRIHVGAKERFELAFSGGVAVRWTSGAGRNLTVASGLGPWPTPLPDDWALRVNDPIRYDDPDLFRAWGPRAAGKTELLEAGPLRVVMRGTWQFPAAEANAEPMHEWQFVIYPSGELYVRVESDSSTAGWRFPRVGYALALDGRAGFTRVADSRGAVGEDDTTFVLMTQHGDHRPDLLWAPSDPAGGTRQVELVSEGAARIAVLAGDVDAAARVVTAHLLRIWPQDIDAAPEARSLARDYQHPARLTFSHGRIETDAPGDLDHDGYNESEGLYETALAGGLLRVTFSPGSIVRFQPRLRVRGSAGRECWVYADGRILDASQRDAAGLLVVELRGPLRRDISIEVHTRGSDRSAAARMHSISRVQSPPPRPASG